MSMTGIGPHDTIVNEREDYDPLRGDSIVQVHEGTEAAMRGLKAVLRVAAPYWPVTVESVDEPLWQCVIRSPDQIVGGDAQAVTVWELWSNDINKSIYEHPNTFKTPPANVDRIKQGVKADESNEEVVADFTGDATQLAYATELLLLVKKGVTDFLVSQFVLRRTQTVSIAYQIKVAFNQIDYVWPTGLLVSVENPPAEILFSIASVPAPEVPPPVGAVQLYRAGWLKKSPTVRQTASNKFEIQQEWWLGVLPYYLYYTAV